MGEIKLNFSKNNIIQIVLTSLTFILTIILPIFGYFQFNISNEKYLENFQERYNLVFIGTIISGVILTFLRFYMYRFSQYTIKRGFLNLLNSIFFVLFLSITAQLGKINIKMENFNLDLNLIGVFVFLIIVWSLFIIKNLYDLYDFKKNRIYYETLVRSKKVLSKSTPKRNP